MDVFVLLYQSGDISQVMDVYDSEEALLRGIADEIAGGRLQKSERYQDMIAKFESSRRVLFLTQALKDGRVVRRPLKGLH